MPRAPYIHTPVLKQFPDNTESLYPLILLFVP